MLEVIKYCKRLKWKIGFIPRVEILKIASKMASEMAASKALKAYLTNRLNKKAFNFYCLWLFRGLMIQTIKLENWFVSEGSNI